MIEEIHKIADYYGYEAQSRQLIEEMAELTKAINKLWRYENACFNGDVYKLKHDIIEEIADVEICLEYVKYLMGRDDSSREIEADVENVKQFKVERELERITLILG